MSESPEFSSVDPSIMDQTQVKEIAREIAKEVVREIFLTVGINAADPTSVQKLQQDFAYLRTIRESRDVIRERGLSAAIWFVVTAGLGSVVAYFIRH